MKTKIKRYKLLPDEKQEWGHCGACGSDEIDYSHEDNVHDDDLIGYCYICRACKFCGVEYNTVKFSHHEDDHNQPYE